ncbi:MAG: HAD family hydrolase [Acidobacteriota bacterium]|nr:HAD family hydrolase [Acidobacteriota bacterium]
MSERAVFFDRDGTLCREVGYVNHPSRLELMPDAAVTLRRLHERGWRAIVVSNQAGIARGYFTPAVLEDTHRRLRRLLAGAGTSVDGLYACVHHPEVGPPGFRRACDCRKPDGGMLISAAREHGIELSESVMVGDSFKDVAAGRAAGVLKTVLLRTGYGRGEILKHSQRTDLWPDHVADDLTGAASWIFDVAGDRRESR